MESGTDTPVSTGPNAVIGRECYTVLNVAPDRLLLCFASKNPAACHDLWWHNVLTSFSADFDRMCPQRSACLSTAWASRPA